MNSEESPPKIEAMSKTIDLGTKSGGGPSPCGHPEVADKKKEPSVHYPTFYVSGVKALHELPDEFEGTATFKIVSRTESQRSGQPESYSCEVEVRNISPSVSSKRTKKEDAESGLDKALSKIEKKKTVTSYDEEE